MTKSHKRTCSYKVLSVSGEISDESNSINADKTQQAFTDINTY